MKKLLLVSSLYFALNSFSQEKTVELNCYNKWAAKFEERGAEEIKDGVYEDVIITVRTTGNGAVCHSGKAEVREGKVVKFYKLLSDGSHEEVVKIWKNKTNENVTITNGISKAMQSARGELVNVLWPNKIKPKKAKPVPAPEPTDD